MSVGRPCTVCAAGLSREHIERAYLAGQPVKSIARDYPSLSESALRRHLNGGHQTANNTFTPDSLDDETDDLTAHELVAGVALGIRRMLSLRDQPGVSPTTVVRAQGEARAGVDALARIGIVDAERMTAQLNGWKAFGKAIRAAAATHPHLIEQLGTAMVDAKHVGVGQDLTKLARSAREQNKEK